MATSAVTQVVEANLEASRVDPALRKKTPRVEHLYALLQERMTRPQGTWGEGMTVLDDPKLADAPLVVRRARAFEKALLEMPIAIDDENLIVGNNARDGVIVRTQLPAYATAAEYDRAADEGASISARVLRGTTSRIEGRAFADGESERYFDS